MPFVQRVVSPIYISRTTTTTTTITTTSLDVVQSKDEVDECVINGREGGGIGIGIGIGGVVGGGTSSINGSSGSPKRQQPQSQQSKRYPVNDNELESVTNLTLSNSLKQLASLVKIAHEIFHELNKELLCVSERSNGIKKRLTTLQERVDNFDPKLVTVRK